MTYRAGFGTKPISAPLSFTALRVNATSTTCKTTLPNAILHTGDLGVDSGWVQNSTLGTEDALSVVSQIAVRVDVAIEGNGPHA